MDMLGVAPNPFLTFFFLKRDWRGLGPYSKDILKKKEYSYVQKLLKEDQTTTLRNKKDQTKIKN
jgi:hypothetical protein